MIYLENSARISDRNRRSCNEDRCWTLTYEPPSPAGRMFIYCVIDGVSQANGQAAAELAAEVTAVEMLPVIQNSGKLAADSEETAADYIRSIMRNAVCRADRRLRQEGETSACTVSLTVVFGDRVHTCNIGDSPIFLMDTRKGILYELYECHNGAGKAVREGRMTAEEARTSPARNCLSLAVGGGVPFEAAEVYTAEMPLPAESVLMLGSDGALSVLPEDKLVRLIMQNSDSMKNMCASIFEAVEGSDSTDNFTLIAAKLRRG